VPTPDRACNDGPISRYEDLRQQALGLPCEIPRGQGLVLLMRSGATPSFSRSHCTVCRISSASP
jgi:hypothetical protein